MTLSKRILILGASFWGDNMREMVILGDTGFRFDSQTVQVSAVWEI